MGPSIAIREVNIDSSDKALHLLERFFREEGFGTPPQEMGQSLLKMITSPTSAVFLAWCGVEVLGVATVTTSVGLEYGLSAELDDLYVLPEERGKGVANELVGAVCSWCRERGASVLLATVTPEGESNHQLLAFYQHLGFANRGRVILERTLDDDRRWRMESAV